MPKLGWPKVDTIYKKQAKEKAKIRKKIQKEAKKNRKGIYKK